MKETASKKSKGKGGWRGEILQVDLSNSKIWDEDLSQKGKIAEAECPAIEELLPKAVEKGSS